MTSIVRKRCLLDTRSPLGTEFQIHLVDLNDRDRENVSGFFAAADETDKNPDFFRVSRGCAFVNEE